MPRLETVLLLVSSTTFRLRLGWRRRQAAARAVLSWLLLTFVLGAGFVFSSRFANFSGMIPAPGAGPRPQRIPVSLSSTLVGTHGTHVSRRPESGS